MCDYELTAVCQPNGKQRASEARLYECWAYAIIIASPCRSVIFQDSSITQVFTLFRISHFFRRRNFERFESLMKFHWRNAESLCVVFVYVHILPVSRLLHNFGLVSDTKTGLMTFVVFE